MSEPIGIAIIGASKRSSMIFKFAQSHPEQLRVVGIFDLIPELCGVMLASFENTDAVEYSSLDEALSDPAVQAVFVGTPDHAHVEVACSALAAGKHVYCEKPLAITLEDCDAIIEASEKASGIFYLGMNLRHAPVYEFVHDMLERGELGKLQTIEANEHYIGGRTYFRRWNRLRKFGGGLWITKAVHDFDLLNWLSGGQPKRVYAVSSLSHYKPRADGGTHCRACKIQQECPDYYDVNHPDSDKWNDLATIIEKHSGVPRDICLYNSDKDTFDNGMAIVEFDNDVRATYTVNVVSSMSTRQLFVSGTKGSLESDLEDNKVTFTPRFKGEPVVTDLNDQVDTSGHGGADSRILNEFVACCRSGKRPRTGAAEGRSSLAVGLAARESCDSGQPVILPKAK